MNIELIKTATAWLLLGVVIFTGSVAAQDEGQPITIPTVPSIIPGGKPDLLPVGTCTFRLFTAGEIGVLNMTIFNVGTADARTTVTGFEFFIFNAPTGQFLSRGAFAIGTNAIPGILAAPSNRVNLPPIRVPAGCPSNNCFFQTVADLTNAIPDEVTEENVVVGLMLYTKSSLKFVRR